MAVFTFPEPDLLMRMQMSVGEGPVFDHRTGRLCWVDITNGTLFENDLSTGQQWASTFDTLLGAVAPRTDGVGFAAAVTEGFAFLGDGQMNLVDPVLASSPKRMNDAKCDSSGRLWAGSTHKEFDVGAGSLHCWDGLGPSSVMASGFTLPNGIGWNASDTKMYMADSFEHVLLSADYHDGESDLDFEPLCDISEGLPDGLAVDVEGCIWIAVWGGFAVHRYDSTGRLIGVVPLPVEKPSSCAFGDDGVLFITSASADLSAKQLTEQPLAGSVFAMSTNTLGVTVHPFGARPKSD